MNLATKKWIFLKISSVILLPLMFWFIVNFVSIYDNNYSEIVKFFTNTNFYKSLGFIISVLCHHMLDTCRAATIIILIQVEAPDRCAPHHIHDNPQ